MTVEITTTSPRRSTTPTINRASIAFAIKWIASIIQILGYTATSFGWTPWNLYFFVFGLLGWFAVGVLWNDRAIILIHAVALIGMIAGLAQA